MSTVDSRWAEVKSGGMLSLQFYGVVALPERASWEPKYLRRRTFFRHLEPRLRKTEAFRGRCSGVEIAASADRMPTVDTYSVIVMVLMVGACLLHGPRVKKWRLAYVRPEPRERRRS